jgi:sugar phosphate permease|tara:strand:- start:408 stop:1640 length:1233 start_codon:yes stop_codon:yes gene_type:complete
MTFTEKWLTMGLLCLSGSVIFWLPLFSDIFYIPMQNAFGFTKTQMGILLSTFGAVALIAYFPGGWLADRFSPRKLITIALVITALAGFVFSTLPSFEICLILFAIWGLTSAGILWSAMIKAARCWGSKEDQGKTFGILEGGRSISDVISTTILLMIFAYSRGDDRAVPEIIIMISFYILVLALLVWRIMGDDISNNKKQPKVTINEIIYILRLPVIWLIALIIMATNTAMWGTIFFTPYATEVYELGEVGGGAIGAGKYWVTPFAAIAAGFFADKIGPAKAILGFCIVMTAGFLIFTLIPGSPALLPYLIINVAILTAAVYALRGTYFSLLEQSSIPLAFTGTATGIISVIAYTPDIFMPTLGGIILDAYPGASGYQYLFLIVSFFSMIGLVAAYVIYQKIQKIQMRSTV